MKEKNKNLKNPKALSEILKKYPNIKDMTGKDGITGFHLGGHPYPPKNDKKHKKN